MFVSWHPGAEGGFTIIVVFKAKAKPGMAESFVDALGRVAAASRKVDGVLGFDVARDVLDPDCFIATEIFEDPSVLDRQQQLPEVADARAALISALAEPPESTTYEVVPPS